MLLNVPGNVTKHSGECRQAFRGISLNSPGMSSNIYCLLQITLSNGRLSKSKVEGLGMGRSFINLFHCLQSIWHWLKRTLNSKLLLSLPEETATNFNNYFNNITKGLHIKYWCVSDKLFDDPLVNAIRKYGNHPSIIKKII